MSNRPSKGKGIFADKIFLWFVAKFLLLFLLLYGSFLAIIALSAPSGIYSAWVDKYFDLVNWIKGSLVWGVQIVVGWMGYATVKAEDYTIYFEQGQGIKIAMDCVGYGVYSFWTAYIVASSGTAFSKLKWVAGGLLLLWCINVLRMSLFLIAINKGKEMPFGIDHHDWFNIVAYVFIFGMIWWRERRGSTVQRVNGSKV